MLGDYTSHLAKKDLHPFQVLSSTPLAGSGAINLSVQQGGGFPECNPPIHAGRTIATHRLIE